VNVIKQHFVAIAVSLAVGYWLGKDGGVRGATSAVKKVAS